MAWLVDQSVKSTTGMKRGSRLPSHNMRRQHRLPVLPPPPPHQPLPPALTRDTVAVPHCPPSSPAHTNGAVPLPTQIHATTQCCLASVLLYTVDIISFDTARHLCPCMQRHLCVAPKTAGLALLQDRSGRCTDSTHPHRDITNAGRRHANRRHIKRCPACLLQAFTCWPAAAACCAAQGPA